MQRPTIPFSQSQYVTISFFSDLNAVDEWLNDLVDVHENDEENPYYLHIDHVQILPPNEPGRIPVLAVYHRVYLQRGV